MIGPEDAPKEPFPGAAGVVGLVWVGAEGRAVVRMWTLSEIQRYLRDRTVDAGGAFAVLCHFVVSESSDKYSGRYRIQCSLRENRCAGCVHGCLETVGWCWSVFEVRDC
jgi:hypothetical protein